MIKDGTNIVINTNDKRNFLFIFHPLSLPRLVAFGKNFKLILFPRCYQAESEHSWNLNRPSISDALPAKPFYHNFQFATNMIYTIITKLLGNRNIIIFMNKIRLLFWLSAMALFLSLIINVSYINLDPDLGWHLKIGQDILASRSLPHDQIYMHTLPGVSWVDHEWLANAAMYLIYAKSGYIGLVFAFVILIMLGLWLSIATVARRYPKQDIIILLWALLGLMGYMWHFGARAQVITWLMLIILFAIIKKWQSAKRPRVLYALPVFFWLWASLHAGFLIGLIVLANYLLFESVLPWLRRRIGWPEAKWPILLGLASFAATWLTPYGYRLYSFLSGYAHAGYLGIVTEWRAIYVPPFQSWQIIFLAVVMAVFIASFIFQDRPQKIKLSDLTIVIFFACMAVGSIRHFPLFYAASCFTVLPFFLRSQADSFPTPRYDWRWLIPALSLLLAAILIISRQEFIKDPFVYYCSKYPCSGVEYIKEHPGLLKLKWLNHYNIGGYLIWTLPEARLYIDGRMPQAPYQDSTLIENFVEFFDNGKALKKLDEEKINLIFWQKIPKASDKSLLSKFSDIFVANDKDDSKTFREIVAESPEWRVVFEDQASIIWQRRQ